MATEVCAWHAEDEWQEISSPHSSHAAFWPSAAHAGAKRAPFRIFVMQCTRLLVPLVFNLDCLKCLFLTPSHQFISNFSSNNSHPVSAVFTVRAAR